MKFIGSLDAADLPRAIESLQPAAAAAGAFTMSVSGLSGFPPHGTPRVIHAGLQETSGTLLALQQAVDAGLVEELGISKDTRRFVPHVTLGRVKDRRRCPKMEVMAAAIEDQDFGEVRVDSMVLMESDLRPDGAVYTPLHRFPLGG